MNAEHSSFIHTIPPHPRALSPLHPQHTRLSSYTSGLTCTSTGAMADLQKKAAQSADAAEEKKIVSSPSQSSPAKAPAGQEEGVKMSYGDPSTMSSSIIDMDIFGQLLEMDDEDDREFSKEIVWNYFDQAEVTFGKMDTALADNDLPELSTLGHFLKGSSAAVGVIKVRDSCEYMQHYGKLADKDGITQLSHEDALVKIQTTLRDVKTEYKEAEKALRKFYADSE